MLKQQKLTAVTVGDLVQLNSGGPHLTVGAVNDSVVTVYWIVDGESARYGKAEFPHVCLHKVARPETDDPVVEKWSQLLRSTAKGIESVGIAPSTNIGAAADGDPAADDSTGAVSSSRSFRRRGIHL